MEHFCPLCSKPMADYSQPMNPLFICDECCCDELGAEVTYCEICDMPYTDDNKCDCEWDYCENCGHDFPMGEECEYCSEE